MNTPSPPGIEVQPLSDDELRPIRLGLAVGYGHYTNLIDRLLATISSRDSQIAALTTTQELDALRCAPSSAWQPIEKGLPSDGAYIQVWIDLKGMHVTDRSYSRFATYGPDGFRDGHCGSLLENVSHWQPEPSPPTQPDGPRQDPNTSTRPTAETVEACSACGGTEQLRKGSPWHDAPICTPCFIVWYDYMGPEGATDPAKVGAVSLKLKAEGKFPWNKSSPTQQTKERE